AGTSRSGSAIRASRLRPVACCSRSRASSAGVGLFLFSSARFAVRKRSAISPPPCGEGLGVGVWEVRDVFILSRVCRLSREDDQHHPTPTPTLRVDPPRKGEGNRI